MIYKRNDEIRTYNTGNTFLPEEKPREGGMGRVYIARRKKDSQLYALKTLLMDKISDDQLKRFKWESQVWIVLGKHKNIIQAHWFDLSQNYEPFLVMEYVKGFGDGVTLADWINKKRTHIGDIVYISGTLNFIIQALTGLIYARNVITNELKMAFIHRDLKPQNLLITENSTLKVTDFGLVKAFGGKDGVAGTPYYMPPEQWKGKEVPEKTDVYALGCILYEMITGKILFSLPLSEMGRYNWRRKIKEMHFYMQPEPVAGIPEKLNEIMLKCLSKESRARFSFKDLREEVQALHQELTGNRVPVKDEPETFSAEDWNGRGVGFDRLGLHEKAVDCYTKAIRLIDSDARFFLNRGNAYVCLKKLQEAITDYRQAIKIHPELLDAYISMGSAYFMKGDFQNALECYNKAEQLNAHEERIYLGRGSVYGKQGQYEKAIQEFRKALKIKGNLAEAHLNLGNAYVGLGNRDKAIEHFNKALSIKEGQYPQAQEMLNKIYLQG